MKVKVGQTCESNKNCINKNCVNGICTRRPRTRKIKIQSVKPQTVKVESVKPQSVKVQTVKVKSVKVKNKKVKVGVKCESNKNCINNNCVNGVCVRKPRTRKIKPQSVKSTKKSANITTLREQSPRFGINTPKKRPMNITDYYVIPDTEEMMKIQDNLSEIGINKKSFFFDPCYFLNNLNKILKAPKFKQFKNDGVLLLPVIYPKNKKYRVDNYEKQDMKDVKEYVKNIKNAVLGNKNLSINFASNYQVGSGSYGTIYKSSVDNKDIVFKIPHENNYEDDLDENIIQNELFCAMRGNWSTGARIPKIEYIARLYRPDRGVVDMKIITGMEKMEGNLLQFINKVLPTFKFDDVERILKDMFIQICELLIKLQDKYDFHHRDFHMGNIMYNNFGTKTNPKYKWYIIDFGMSYMNIEGRKYHADAINLYEKYKSPNKSFDLRILFTNINELETLTDAHPKCKIILFIRMLCKKIYKEYIFGVKIYLDDFITPWHASYNTFDYKLETDVVTDPREFIKVIKKM